MGFLRTASSGAAWAVAAAVVAVPMVQPGGLLGPDLALASSALSVSGSVADLQPGVPASLVLTVHNDDSAAVVVRELRVQVTRGGTPTCPSSALQVDTWRGDLVVPAAGSASQPLSVLLDAGAVCDGVRWSLHYTAVAA